MDFQQKGKDVYTDMEQWTEIRQRVLRDGVSKRQILRETGMHWETLKKILEHSSPPGYKRSKLPKKPKIGPYIDRIREILEQESGQADQQQSAERYRQPALDAPEGKPALAFQGAGDLGVTEIARALMTSRCSFHSSVNTCSIVHASTRASGY